MTARVGNGLPGLLERHHITVARLPAIGALLLIGVLYALMPAFLRLGPIWLLPLFLVVLVIALLAAGLSGNHTLMHGLGRACTVLVTLAVALSAVFLATRLPGNKVPGPALLRWAVLIWGANILVFALWYWEMDAGGPVQRHRRDYVSRDFAFPQVQESPPGALLQWSPGFVDYVFLAFNTSTAFSPTDTLVLSQRMKLLMMTQSLISLLVISVLAARAINTIQ